MESLTGFCSLAMAILFFFALYKIKDIYQMLAGVIGILMPLIYGLVIAFVLSPVCNTFTEILENNLPEFKNPERRKGLVKGGGVALSVLTAVIIVYILIAMIVPQLFESIMTIVYNMDDISDSVVSWGNSLFQSRPELQQQFQEFSTQVGEYLGEWVQNTLVPEMQGMIGSLSLGVISVLSVLKNIIIGLIISVYILFNRKLYSAQAKKILYSTVPSLWANRTMGLVRETRDVFSGFIMGKLLDSLIIGILCFIVMAILNMPYVMLISTIVGVTNIIPYFGPFFGAIPSAFLILTVSPLKMVYFVIFILILQQVDGNIIGPKILGSSTGLASFWVLFSLLLFGGVWGVIGMIIGVPLFAIIYDLISHFVTYRLEKKEMPKETSKYGDLDHVDPQTGAFVMKDGRVIEHMVKPDLDVEDSVESE